MNNTGRLSLFLHIFFIYIQAMHTNIRSRGYLCFMYLIQYACSHRPSEYSGCQHKYPPCITFLHTIEVLLSSMYTDGSPLLSPAVQGSHQRLCKMYRSQRKSHKSQISRGKGCVANICQREQGQSQVGNVTSSSNGYLFTLLL